MKRILTCSLAIVMLASMADAALRARYFWAPNHDPDGNSSGSPDVYRTVTFQKIVPGIWNDYDPETGFDGVMTKGDFSNAPWVTAEYWIDSVFEFASTSKRKDAPLMEGWATDSDLLDPSYQMSSDGYCVIAAGGIKIDEPGTYQFDINSNDGAMLWIDSNNDGEIDLTSGELTMGNEIVNKCPDGASDCGTYNQLRCFGDDSPDHFAYQRCQGTYEVELNHTGLTKIMVWYWDWGEVGHFELSWKKPGGVMEPISGTNGDLGQPKGGPPIVRITDVKVDGVSQSSDSWGNLDVTECVPVTFTTSASSMQGATPVFMWDFYGDGRATLETSDTEVTYKYQYYDDIFLVQPSVRVKRGETVSEPSSQTDVIFIWLSDDESHTGECPGNPGTSVEQAKASASIGTMKLAGTRVLVPATGRNVVNIYNAVGRQVMSLTPKASVNLSTLGLTRGYYVVKMVQDGRRISSTPVMINGR